MIQPLVYIVLSVIFSHCILKVSGAAVDLRPRFLLPGGDIEHVTFLSSVAGRMGNDSTEWFVNITARASYDSTFGKITMAPLIKLVEELSCEDTSGFDREQFNFMKQIIRRRGSENQPFWVSMNSLADNIIFPRPTDDDGLTHCAFTYNASLDEGFSQISGPVNSVGRLQVIGPEGFSLIADIDDTIRITEVPSMSRSLFNTFCKPFVAPQGMPEFFSVLNNSLSIATSPLQVHYISGSPVELARPLQTFIDAAYIPGSLDLRNYEFSFLGPGRNGTQIHKLEAIDLLMDRFPQRKFLMIGDSGEQDPDTYARAFRKWGATRTIQCIFIRQVPGVNNTLERFVQDFQDVPPEKWAVFEDPSELMNLDVLNGQCRPSGQL